VNPGASGIRRYLRTASALARVLIALTLAGCGGQAVITSSSSSTTSAQRAASAKHAAESAASRQQSPAGLAPRQTAATAANHAPGSAASAAAMSRLGVLRSTHSLRASRSHHAGGVRGTTNPSAPPAKKFELHASLAFGIFDHDIYVPFVAGKLERAANDKRALARAGAAGLAAYDQVAKAKQAVAGSQSLLPLYGPLAALGAMLTTIADALHRGRAESSSIDATNAAIKGIKQTAYFSGVEIIDRVPSP